MLAYTKRCKMRTEQEIKKIIPTFESDVIEEVESELSYEQENLIIEQKRDK